MLIEAEQTLRLEGIAVWLAALAVVQRSRLGRDPATRPRMGS
jgi:hypothetical protein